MLLHMPTNVSADTVASKEKETDMNSDQKQWKKMI